MSTRTHPRTPVMGAILAVAASWALASIERAIWTDPIGDACARRTDSGADGSLLPEAILPDLVSVSVFPWAPSQPATDPYTGLPTAPAEAQMFRLDVVLAGRVNPPGTLGLNGADYLPNRFGSSPMYGFVEIDIDNDIDTGGEFPGPARSRVLGTSARFGGRISDPALFERQAVCGADLDALWDTQPFFERTGTDFALTLCGCFDAAIVSETGNLDGKLDSGEEMIVRGRFFQRSGGYRLASQFVGGSDIGLYDPVVDLRFVHEPASNLTIVTLVFPLTQAGAAALTGEPEQPIDTLIGEGSHTSIAEAVADLLIGAGGSNFGLTHALVHRWSKKDPQVCLNPLLWSINAAVGTAYATPEDAPYVWTDISCPTIVGDMNGDSFVTPADRAYLEEFILANDGTASDVDGQVNGEVVLENIGPNFNVLDITGDGAIGALDTGWFQFPAPCRADWDQNGAIQVSDIFAFLSSWFAGQGDFDLNGWNEVPDIFAFLSEWFANNCI